jgi:hypothetical protein
MPEGTLTKQEGVCFVVMGFGKKTDFETGRTLDLDKTYQNIIKPAVAAAGLKCVRADDIVHSGLIDVPMYDQLLKADLVIADLSTANKNAFYELGIRHALRPFTTIVICEDGFKTPPFDVNHIVIRRYHHLGEDIGYSEVERFRKDLTDAIVEVYNKNPRPYDSPVYTFVEHLTPPSKAKALVDADKQSDERAESLPTHSELMQQADEAQQAGDFEMAKNLLKLVLKRRTMTNPNASEDPYIIQRLALVTYKQKQDTQEKEIAALKEACDLLYKLDPATSNDTETLSLWGAVHKRLWEKSKDTVALNKAIRSYERGFYLRNDYYNGINFAFLLNIRAAHSAGLAKNSADPGETARYRAASIADFTQAERIRQEVVAICDRSLGSIPVPDERASAEEKEEYLKSKYWVVASQAEAYLGTGNTEAAAKCYEEAYSLAPASWMVDSAMDQRQKLQALLADSPLKYIKTNGA